MGGKRDGMRRRGRWGDRRGMNGRPGELSPSVASTKRQHAGWSVSQLEPTHCRPTVVSVLSLTFRPCDARCLVRAVLSFIPLNSFGEKTSKVLDIAETISTMAPLGSASTLHRLLHFAVGRPLSTMERA